jgi:hypothetical protein
LTSQFPHVLRTECQGDAQGSTRSAHTQPEACVVPPGSSRSKRDRRYAAKRHLLRESSVICRSLSATCRACRMFPLLKS